MADYDLAIIGGGLNGVSIARDAAGRGLRVILLEQGDLGSAASSASPRLIHGDLAVLERRGFRRVRAALAERDIWLKIAPHLVRPMRFAIPAHSDERPPWLLRAGLWLYDRLASRKRPAGRGDGRRHPSSARQRAEAAVRHRLRIFRLRGGRFAAGDRQCRRRRRARRRHPHRRALRSRRPARDLAAGGDRSRPAPGDHGAGAGQRVGRLDRVSRGNRLADAAAARAAAMQISQIVVRRLFETDNVYVFQNSDRRLIFASPYERDFTLIGTVGHRVQGRSRRGVDGGGRRRLSLRRRQPVFSRAGRTVRRDQDDFRRQHGRGPSSSRGLPRDGAMRFEARRGKAPLLTVFGGDVTTSRLRAERAVSKLTPFYPMSPRWTAKAPLPGGDFAWARFEAEVDRARERWPLPRRGRGAAAGRRLWLAACRRARRRQSACRSRSGVRAGTDGRGGALSHGQGMGALSGRHSLAPLQARPDHAGQRSRGAGGVMAKA